MKNILLCFCSITLLGACSSLNGSNKQVEFDNNTYHRKIASELVPELKLSANKDPIKLIESLKINEYLCDVEFITKEERSHEFHKTFKVFTRTSGDAVQSCLTQLQAQKITDTNGKHMITLRDDIDNLKEKSYALIDIVNIEIFQLN